ncbi:putative 39S ribosomal protein L32, mitochondrial [Aphelenchoides bicaudatus]|nr:putative 39S ribosomal protein L32, mitochondrial [Aphelenchoides bicaudatus]
MRFTWLLFGVPKFRTCKPKKTNRKFSHTRLIKYNEYIIKCQACGNPHMLETVCGECYRGIKNETDKIKTEQMGLHKIA